MSGLALLYGFVVGFAIAGLAASAFEYVTDKRLVFEIPPETGAVGTIAGFFIRLIAGPYMVARFLLELMRTGEARWLVLAGSVLVVSWSLSSGIVFVTSFMH